jgi:hypothetical protein
MKTVTLAYAIEHGQRTLIGVGESIDKAVDLIKKSGFGFHMTKEQLALLAILSYTVNLEVNFKLETWQVH